MYHVSHAANHVRLHQPGESRLFQFIEPRQSLHKPDSERRTHFYPRHDLLGSSASNFSLAFSRHPTGPTCHPPHTKGSQRNTLEIPSLLPPTNRTIQLLTSITHTIRHALAARETQFV